jgi:hypothetical protein
MATYFFLLTIPSVLAMSSSKRNQTIWMVFVFLVFVFVVGFRLNVGMDWNNYEDMHDWIARAHVTDLLLQPEPLSSLLFWSSAKLGLGSTLSNITAAIILMLGVLSYAARTRDPWIALVAATPYLIIAFGMSGIRQAMAAGVMLLVVASWERTSLLGRTLGMVIASLFHTSAFLGLLFVLWDSRLSIPRKLIFAAIVFGIFYSVGGVTALYTDSWRYYQDAYMAGPQSIESPGVRFHVLLVALPAVIYFLYKVPLDKVSRENPLIMKGAVVAVLLLPLMLVSTTGASRLTVYLYFVPMFVYAALPRIFVARQKALVLIGVVSFHFFLLAGWLLFANNSAAHIPYRNLFWQ